jgi:site-specific recombinase XerD
MGSGHHRAVHPRERGEHFRIEPDDYIFCGFDGKPVSNFTNAFKKVLADTGLLEDRWGKARSIYSLRHFYCTQSLLSGVPIHMLAKNMGTSVTHIENHYSHVLTLMQARQLQTKKFRPAKREAPKTPKTGQ